MIANSGQLGLDWRTLDLSSYFEALEAHGEANDPNAKREMDSEDRSEVASILKKRMAEEA